MHVRCGLGVVAVGLLVGLLGVARGADESPWWKVDLKPQVIGKDSGDPTFGIGISKSHQELLFRSPGQPYEIDWGFDLESLIAIDADKNPEPTTFEGKIVVDRDYAAGTLSADVHGSLEADQRFDNVNALGGTALLYAPPLRATGLWPPVVHASARIDYVDPAADDNREAVGVDDQEAFVRTGLSASWFWRPSDTFDSWTGLMPLSFSIGYRYFRESSQQKEWEATGQDEYDYATAMVSWYRGPAARLREVFVQVSDGRMPTGSEDDTTYFLGFVVDPVPRE